MNEEYKTDLSLGMGGRRIVSIRVPGGEFVVELGGEADDSLRLLTFMVPKIDDGREDCVRIVPEGYGRTTTDLASAGVQIDGNVTFSVSGNSVGALVLGNVDLSGPRPRVEPAKAPQVSPGGKTTLRVPARTTVMVAGAHEATLAPDAEKAGVVLEINA